MRMLFEFSCVVQICFSLAMRCHALLLRKFAMYLWRRPVAWSCRSAGSCHRSVPHVSRTNLRLDAAQPAPRQDQRCVHHRRLQPQAGAPLLSSQANSIMIWCMLRND
jgi:hypothetical protein